MPFEIEEAPLIQNICPHCNAVDIDWRKYETSSPETLGFEEDIFQYYQCPHCSSSIRSDSFHHIYSDDFVDIMTPHLPSGWKIIATNHDWHQVELCNDELQLFGDIEIDVDSKGQINYQNISEKIAQIR